MVIYGLSVGGELEHYNIQASFMSTYSFKPKLIAGEIK